MPECNAAPVLSSTSGRLFEHSVLSTRPMTRTNCTVGVAELARAQRTMYRLGRVSRHESDPAAALLLGLGLRARLLRSK